MYLKKPLYFLCIAMGLSFCGIAQPQLQQVPHCPSNEIYDMLTDKKGFIWIAHNLGISRYDGISFTSFSNPEQTAISMTDLLEDNYGRIWCHNFNGQIFYIQNEKMFCLKEYDFTKEHVFPRMTLLGNELIITSSTGLFICNTVNLGCKYIKIINGLPFSTSSICLVNNSVLLFSTSKLWCGYSKERGIYKVDENVIEFLPSELSALQPHASGDTIFLMNYSRSTLFGFRFKDNRLLTSFIKPLRTQFNTVSMLNGRIWVNTKTGSFTLDGKDSLNGYNVTAMMHDKEENTWYCSISNGLLVTYKTIGWKKLKPMLRGKGDYIKCIKKNNGILAYCSQYGEIMLSSRGYPDSFSTVSAIYQQAGTAENIQVADSDNYFIEMSNEIFLFNVVTHKVKGFEKTSVKDALVIGDTVFMAGSAMMRMKSVNGYGLNNIKKAKPFSIKDTLLMYVDANLEFKKRLRCRALAYDAFDNSLLVSFADGLQKIKDSRLSFVLFKGKPLYVSSMAKYNNKIYAATFNNGLFVIESGVLRRIENGMEPNPDAIVKIKCCNNHIWIFTSHDIELLDADNDVFVKKLYPFPVDVSDITDVEENESSIYLATIHGLYSLPLLKTADNLKTSLNLLYLLVNSKDTVQKDNITLPSEKNNLLFRLAIPVYKNAEQLHFKYRLGTGNNNYSENEWYYTQDAQRDIQFNSLKPGSYSLEIIAVKDNEIVSSKPLTYFFTILQPWYNTWWFYTGILLLSATVFFALYRYRLRQILKIELVRRKISSDLHDDIGSTLSSINVYSQLAKAGIENNEYINTIQTNAVEIINSLDDLVWNINPKNDVLGQLINRMQLFAQPLLHEKGIECIFKIKAADKGRLASPDTRANIFLLFKEAINNVIKHSGGTTCHIYFIQKGASARLIVKDNGRGFNVNTINRHRNGLYNMQQRMEDLKGNISINSSPGNGTEIKITCRI